LLTFFIGSDFIFPPPHKVVVSLYDILFSGSLTPIFTSIFTIFLGFLTSLILGVVLASLGYRFLPIREFFSPLMAIFKSVPVATISILLSFIFFKNREVIIIVLTMMMVVPIIYTNILSALLNIDKKLLVVANLYNISKKDRILYIYISNIFPAFMAGVKIACGLAFKAGIAAELILQLSGTIGSELYLSKMYLLTSRLLAWTMLIILLSICFEKLMTYLLFKIKQRIER
jgi:NitT/TauT family transport system permease protein